MKEYYSFGGLRAQFTAQNDNDEAARKALSQLFAVPDYALKKAVIEQNDHDFEILMSSDVNSKQGLNEAVFHAAANRRLSYASILLKRGADRIEFNHGVLCAHAERGDIHQIRRALFDGANPNAHGGESFKRALLAEQMKAAEYLFRQSLQLEPILTDEKFTRTLWRDSSHSKARRYLSSLLTRFPKQDMDLS